MLKTRHDIEDARVFFSEILDNSTMKIIGTCILFCVFCIIQARSQGMYVYSYQLQRLQRLNFSNDEHVLLKVNCVINQYAIQAHCLGTAII